ncbi:MAG: HD domain-containing protein [Nitrososphaera sp.]
MVKGTDLDPFFQSALQLKSVKRAGWVSKVGVKGAESVADHSFSLCAIAMLLADIMGLDTKKAMKMVILHDLPESIIGDLIPGDIAAAGKVGREKKAMSKILSSLPSNVRSEYQQIWTEYLQNRSEVARFVHRIDKLEMAMQARKYARQGHAEKLLAPFFESANQAVGDKGDIVNQVMISLGNPRTA